MTREDIAAYMLDTYQVTGDNPWPKYEDDTVYRHKNNKKWFALLIPVSEDKLGRKGDKVIDILNVKCDPVIIGSITKEHGIYTAYHMNKQHWISIAINDADDENIKALIDISYEKTRTKVRKK